MRGKVLITFDGIEEKQRFHEGNSYEFTDERAQYLAGLGFIAIEGEQSPSPKKKKRGRK